MAQKEQTRPWWILGLAGAGAFALGAGVASLRKTPKKSSPAIFALNRPTAYPRTVKSLPTGDNPIQLYSVATPNGQKVTIALEEMGLRYDAHTIHIGQGDQFTTGFTDINPNQRIPALLDLQGPQGKPVRVFESGSILLYLAEKTGKLIPPRGTTEYVECMNWLFFQHGSMGPMFGQFGHFYHYAPEKIEYAINRYAMEAKRILHVLDQQLARHPYIAGDNYTIADISIFAWVRAAVIAKGYNNGYEFLKNKAVGRVDEYKNVEAWVNRIDQREAVIAGLKVNADFKSVFGDDKGAPHPLFVNDEAKFAK